MKGRKPIYLRVVQVLIVVLAWGYLGYQLLVFDDYASLSGHFSQAHTAQWLCLLAAFLLFPVNMLLEAFKWRSLLHNIVPLSVREAQQQVYYGTVGAFFTPARLGEFPTRALLLSGHRSSAVVLGFVGSAVFTLVIVIIGLPALLAMGIERLSASLSLSFFVGSAVVLIVALLLLPTLSGWLHNKVSEKHTRSRSILAALSQLDSKQIALVGLWSSLRYLIFCLQLWLVLMACGANFQLLTAIPAYYLLVTVTPSVPVADIAIRGSWAIVVFGGLGMNVVSITIATVLMWIINTICPMMVGTFAYKKKKL